MPKQAFYMPGMYYQGISCTITYDVPIMWGAFKISMDVKARAIKYPIGMPRYSEAVP